jgi:hypothetical protein
MRSPPNPPCSKISVVLRVSVVKIPYLRSSAQICGEVFLFFNFGDFVFFLPTKEIFDGQKI